MRKDEYIAEVTSGIKSESARQEISTEIGSHIDELADFYLERGYTETEAEEKAVAEMGDGEKIGYDLSRLHKGKMNLLEKLFLLLAVNSALNLAFFHPLPLGYANFISHYDLIEEFIFLLFFLGWAVYAKHRHYKGISVFLAVVFPLVILRSSYCELIPTDFCSPTVFYGLYIILGRFESIQSILNIYVTELPLWLSVVSIAFYALIAYLLIKNAVSVCKLSTQNYSLKDKAIARRAARTCIVVAIFSATVFTIAYPLSFRYYNDEINSPSMMNGKSISVIIAQSDTPCDLSALTPEDMLAFECINSAIRFEPYFNSSRFYSDCVDMHYSDNKKVSYDEFVKYEYESYAVTVRPTKRYIYVAIKEQDNYNYQDFKLDYDEGIWQETDKAQSYISSDGEIAPNSYMTVTVNPRDTKPQSESEN